MASLRELIGCALVLFCGGCFSPNDGDGNATDTEADGTGTTAGPTSDPSASSNPTSPTTSPSEPTTSPTSASSTTETTSPTSGPTSTTDDSSGDVTPPPDCAAETHQCVDAAPRGWSGPVAVYRGDVDSPAPACAFPYAVPDAELAADLDVPAATCECECEPPGDATCTGGSITYQSTSATCDTPSTTYLFNASGCANFGGEFFSIRYWEFDASDLQVIGSDCTPMPTENIPPATHGSVVVACGGVENDGDCGNEQLCVPDPEAPFSGSLCVWQAGDVECPADSDYTEKTLYFESVSDGRDCPTCGCGNLGGSCDNPTATLRADASCGGAAGNVLTPGSPCQTGGAIAPDSAELDFDVDPSCTPNGGGDPEGDVTENGPHTFCCTP